MAPYKSPFADPSAVQKIAGDLKTLSTKSVDIEEGIVKAKRQVDEIFQKYGSDFSILSEIPSFFSEFSKNFTKTSNQSRDVATKIKSEFDDFLMILDLFVEKITTKEELQTAITALKDSLKTDIPLVSLPLDGFQGATKEFTYIWSLKVDETKHIIDVLEAAINIKETIKKLITELKPVKGGIINVQQALKDYASHIRN